MMGVQCRRRIIAACACLAATGCTTLREIPRAEYAQLEMRKRVVVETREGLEYRFDHARFGSDSLVGYRLRDTEGLFEEYHTVAIPLETIARLSERRVSWLRTGLVGGAGVAALITTAASRRGNGTSPADTTGGLPGDLP